MVADSWFRSLWGKPRKSDSSSPQKSVIGVLSFELASLMSKSVHLWHSLSDKNVARLREEIANSVGIRKLVSEDEDYIANLIRSEMIDNVAHVARSVARLGQRCGDPSLKNFEAFFENMMALGVDSLGWKFSSKKMERKVKKMEKFILMNANLYQEMEVLGELEQTFKRMKASESSDPGSLLEYQKKVAWKRHEVRSLQESSLWNRSYDYAVVLLVRSLFTIFFRIKLVFGIQQVADLNESKEPNTKISSAADYTYRSQSVSALLQASVHPAESDNHHMRFLSGPLGRAAANSGPMRKAKPTKNFYSGPLMGSTFEENSVYGKNSANVGLYSGPLKKSTKSGPLFGASKIARVVWRSSKGHSSILSGKKSNSKHKQLALVGPMTGTEKPANCDSNQGQDMKLEEPNDGSFLSFSSKHRLLNDAPRDSLGHAGLALHYANVIIVIEKLASSPHLIGLDARDDLYDMLPGSVRSSLRARLKPYAKALPSCDSVLAGEWTEAISGILEWLGPLAHNMIRWQSERSYEQQNLVSRANILLVQTLYFANLEKTETIITELLVGLNYIWRLGRELNSKAFMECASSRGFDEYLDMQA